MDVLGLLVGSAKRVGHRGKTSRTVIIIRYRFHRTVTPHRGNDVLNPPFVRDIFLFLFLYGTVRVDFLALSL
jgi:hypothetical protein